ncbi:exonuclease domain-containing protein [Salinactinospora qingdaonensis]|uniref:3'-5' exonuclease n=1 Tax=Salinactinospora qingdaonensis TaxID=702744 RepID=A0ABP7GAV0_9ACTN
MRNRYAGFCTTCGMKVAAAAGAAVKDSNRWRVYCADHAPAHPAPPTRGDHPGWHTAELAGYDCETSSNDPREAFLVSAAIVDDTGEPLTWLVDPGEREIPQEAVAIHGISTERARAEGSPAEQALTEIADVLSAHLSAGKGLAIFNAPFDLGVLDNELWRRGLPSLSERIGGPVAPIIDPLVLDRGIDRYRRGPRNLAAMCSHYGVDLSDAHTALADAAACLALSQEIGARYPDLAVLSLPELHQRQIDWANEYARDRQAWLDKRRPGHGTVIDGTWPLVAAAPPGELL